MLEEFKLIVEDSGRAHIRRDFEEHFGREVPEYRLTRFLKALESISPMQSRPSHETPNTTASKERLD